MNILIVGYSKAGSWAMRGVQMGAALGARVVPVPSAADLRWASIVVLVKRAGLQFAAQVHQSGRPLVWDALDFWSQPVENRFTEGQAKALFMGHIATIQPTLTIGATKAMAAACGGGYVPHHAWAGLSPTPARECVQTVAYQGGEVYLGRWRGVLERECKARGWRFVVNPADLSQADILVAFRDGVYDGWMPRAWKSGVKVVNAIAAGRPIICQDSVAVHELDPCCWIVETAENLALGFDYWSKAEWRANVAQRSAEQSQEFTLAAVAQRYRSILEAQVQTCAA